jgi:hypothetical protein
MNLLSRVFRKIAGPADGLTVRRDGTKLWYLGGHLHRDNGPAIGHAKRLSPDSAIMSITISTQIERFS